MNDLRRIWQELESREVAVTAPAVRSSPSMTAFEVAAARASVCHSCLTALAVVDPEFEVNQVSTGEMFVITSIRSSRFPTA